MKATICARVSKFEQDPENQLRELRQYVAARGWTAVEFVDRGVSGSKDKRPALDALVKDQSGGGSMCSCAGDWIASGATCGT